MSLLLSIVLINIFVCTPNEAARILAVFPVPSISHQVVFRSITQELSKRGHEIVVITTDPVFVNRVPPPNFTEIDVHDISYNVWQEAMADAIEGEKSDIESQMKVLLHAIALIFDAQLKHEDVQKMIQDKNQKFDLILAEACVTTTLIFPHVYKAPAIQISSLGAVLDNYETIGAPSHPFLYPKTLQRKIYNLTNWEKVIQLYKNYIADYDFKSTKELENEILRKHFGINTPSIEELKDNIHLLLLNIHQIFEGVRPVPPNVVYLGGLHQKPYKNLPNDLQEYLDLSKHGVIYISFGTNVDPSLLPPQTLQSLLKTFSKLPYDVLWKWNKDELPGRTDNIKIFKWLPQSDLLRHPKIKLFVTQGGLQSTDEAITAGVPLIGIPVYGDQWYNVEKYVYHKIGLKLEMETLTEEKFTDAVNTVISDKSYRKNIIRLRELINDEPMKPLERAVWWIEYVIRNGGAKHLRPAGFNITWTQYLEIELLCYVIAIMFTTILIFTLSIYAICKLILGNMSLKIKQF